MKKYIRNFIKKLKVSINSYEAKPLLNSREMKGDELALSYNFNASEKKKFYIIQRSPGAGLFSNLIFILNHVKIAESCGFTPIVDMKNFPTIYNENVAINKSKNSWNYFFDNKEKYDLNNIYKNQKYFLTNNRFYKFFSYEVDNTEYRKLFNKYFRIKKSYQKIVKNFQKKNFLNEKVLAIHLRGTSYKDSANHPFPTTLNQTKYLIDKLIKQYNYTKLFLITEDMMYYEFLKKIYNKKLVYLENVYKSYKDDAFKVYPRKLHRYKLGKDILIESMLISKCEGFIYTDTNVSKFVKFLDKNKKLKYYLIENGFNSSNAYIAKWLWYYKNLVPPLIGGFKNKVNVKKIN